MDEELRRLASQRPWSVFTTQDAARMGVRDRQLAQLVSDHRVDHLGRGLYALAGVTSNAVERHAQLSAGALLQYPDAMLTCQSAVIAHGLPVWSTPLRRALIQRDVDRERVSKHLVVRPLRLLHDPVFTVLGRALPPAPAVVLHTIENGIGAGLVSADFALHEKLVTAEELEAVADEVFRWPDSGRIHTLLATMDGRSESVGESRLRLDLAMARIDVVPQVEIRDEHGEFVGRVDLLVAGTKVVIEFDGLLKYGDADGRAALVREKRREDRLRALGYLVVRVTWSDLDHPARVIAMVRRAIAIAA